jgi:hypothetical protein
MRSYSGSAFTCLMARKVFCSARSADRAVELQHGHVAEQLRGDEEIALGIDERALDVRPR